MRSRSRARDFRRCRIIGASQRIKIIIWGGIRRSLGVGDAGSLGAAREIGNSLPSNQRQRRTCYALCHILYPVSAAHTSIFRMDSNSTSYWGRRMSMTPAAISSPYALTPNTVELIPTLGALPPPRRVRPGPGPHRSRVRDFRRCGIIGGGGCR